MDQSILLQWLLYSVVVQLPSTMADVSTPTDSIVLSSSGDATLDIPISFTATYNDFKESEDELEYAWYDDTWNSHKEPMLSGQSNWSLTYDKNRYRYYTGVREVTVEVKKKWSLWIIAIAHIQFILSPYLSGDLLISQTNVTTHTPGYISTGNQTNLTALVDDPDDWMKRRTMYAEFVWIINDKIIATCDTPSLLINITEPNDYRIQANVFLFLSSEIITTTTNTPTTATTPTTTQKTITSPVSSSSTTTTTTTMTSPIPTETTSKPPHPKIRTWKCSGWWPSNMARRDKNAGNYAPADSRISKQGSFTVTTKARDPIGILNVTGEQWLTRNKLLNISVQCSGSGSWTYCFTVHYGSYNVTGNETCLEPLVTTVCDFKLIHFFKRNGTFTYLIIISNEVSTQIQTVPIKIYNVDRKPQLTYIIIPVSCSLVVIIIIIFGSAFLLQSRKRYLVEVADFDFEVSDDVIYNKTMYSQLREAFVEALSTKNDNNSDDDDEDNHWRERSRVVECPRFLEGSNHYGALHS